MLYIQKGLRNSDLKLSKGNTDDFKRLMDYKPVACAATNKKTLEDFKISVAEYCIAGEFKELKRTNDNLKTRNILFLDFDGVGDYQTLIDACSSHLSDVSYIIYPTISDNFKEKDKGARARVVIKLSRSIIRAEYKPLKQAIYNQIHLSITDNSDLTWSQMAGLPVITEFNKIHEIVKHDGKPFEVDSVDFKPIKAAAVKSHAINKINSGKALETVKRYADKHKDSLMSESGFTKVLLELAGNVVNKEIDKATAVECVRYIAFDNEEWQQNNVSRLNDHIESFKKQPLPHKQLPFNLFFKQSFSDPIDILNEGLETKKIKYIAYPEGCTVDTFQQNEAEYNKEFNKNTPSWLDIFIVVKGKQSSPYLAKGHKVDITILGKELVKVYNLISFPAMRSGARYREKNNVWEVFKKNGNTDLIKSVITDIYGSWGIYTVGAVNEAVDFILSDMYKRELYKNPFDNSNPALVAFTNGTFNMNTGELEANRKENYLLNSHDYDLDMSGAATPATDKLLTDMIGDASTFLKEFIGYCFYRSYSVFNKAVFFYGTGGEGKSTLINYLVKDVFGDGNHSAVPPEKLAGEKSRFDTSQLYGKEINFSADINNEYLKNTAVLKNLTGGDSIEAEYKGLQGFPFVSYAKLLFSANKLPTFKDTSNGFRDRLVVIKFINGDTRTKEHRNFWKNHSMEQVRSERSKFVYSCIKSFMKAKERGYMTITDNMKENTSDWIDENNTIRTFINDELKGCPQARIATQELFNRYGQWSQDNGFKSPLSKPNFTKELIAEFNRSFTKIDKITKDQWNLIACAKVEDLPDLIAEYTPIDKLEFSKGSIRLNAKYSRWDKGEHNITSGRLQGFEFPLRMAIYNAIEKHKALEKLDKNGTDNMYKEQSIRLQRDLNQIIA